MRLRSPWCLLLLLAAGGPQAVLRSSQSSAMQALVCSHSKGDLLYEVRDGDTDQLIPAKLTLIGTAGTADPQLGQEVLETAGLVQLDRHEDGRCHSHTDIGLQEGDAIVAYNRIMSASGTVPSTSRPTPP